VCALECTILLALHALEEHGQGILPLSLYGHIFSCISHLAVAKFLGAAFATRVMPQFQPLQKVPLVSIGCPAALQVVLFDVQQRITLGELSTPFVKYVVWSKDMAQVALLSKHAIIIADKKLANSCTVHETIRVKVRALCCISSMWMHGTSILVDGDFLLIRLLASVNYPVSCAAAQSAAWDDNGVLVYTTLNHIKYCLPNGDSGIIRTLDVPVYIIQVRAGKQFEDAHCSFRTAPVTIRMAFACYMLTGLCHSCCRSSVTSSTALTGTARTASCRWVSAYNPC